MALICKQTWKNHIVYLYHWWQESNQNISNVSAQITDVYIFSHAFESCKNEEFEDQNVNLSPEQVKFSLTNLILNNVGTNT